MFLIRRSIMAVTLAFIAINTYAGKDPIGWSMTGSLPANAIQNHSYAINFTLTNNMPFTMPTPLEVQNNSTPASEVTKIDSCSGVRLAPNQSCNVGLVLIAKSAGKKSLSVFMEYGKNKVQIPKTPLTTTAQAAGTSLLQGMVSPGFPTAVMSNTTYTLNFVFTNNGSTPLSNVAFSQNSGNSAGYTQTGTNNCGATLPAGESCAISGTFTTAATSGAVTVGYTLTSSTLSSTAVTSSIINNSSAGATRTFTFVNNCSQTVWLGLEGGSVNGNPCKSDSDCSHGSLCNPSANAGNGLCFYINPVPAHGQYGLAPSGGTKTVTIVDYGLQYVWSGNVAGRTGTSCGTGTCDSADCNNGNGNSACPIGGSFNQPASLGEFTLLRNNIDSYDVSILNGTNIGIELTPTTSYTFNPNGITPSEYNCTSPGKPTQSNGLGNCVWTFTPPAPAYKYTYVKPTVPQPVGGLGCTTNAPCGGGDVCGLYYDRTASPTTLNSYCGKLLGYNTPNQVCSFKNTNLNPPGTPNNLGNPYFPCDTAISPPPTGISSYTYWALYACKAQPGGVLGTCYNTIANPPASPDTCCGCVDWQSYGGGIVVPGNTISCVNTNNTAWINDVLPGIAFMKLGCPTAYAYPFDDKASSFGCMDIQGSHTTNTVNYTITFCPS